MVNNALRDVPNTLSMPSGINHQTSVYILPDSVISSNEASPCVRFGHHSLEQPPIPPSHGQGQLATSTLRFKYIWIFRESNHGSNSTYLLNGLLDKTGRDEHLLFTLFCFQVYNEQSTKANDTPFIRSNTSQTKICLTSRTSFVHVSVLSA